jgi:hypothetical protein
MRSVQFVNTIPYLLTHYKVVSEIEGTTSDQVLFIKTNNYRIVTCVHCS